VGTRGINESGGLTADASLVPTLQRGNASPDAPASPHPERSISTNLSFPSPNTANAPGRQRHLAPPALWRVRFRHVASPLHGSSGESPPATTDCSSGSVLSNGCSSFGALLTSIEALERLRMHSHAGAWEREDKCCDEREKIAYLSLETMSGQRSFATQPGPPFWVSRHRGHDRARVLVPRRRTGTPALPYLRSRSHGARRAKRASPARTQTTCSYTLLPALAYSGSSCARRKPTLLLR
jgi:hypothetical protein